MKDQTKTDLMLAVTLTVCAAVLALFVYGLVTDDFGIAASVMVGAFVLALLAGPQGAP